MKLFSPITASLCLASFASASHAQTLTISDQFAPHADIVRYDSFSTLLNASSTAPPNQGSEIKVTGPVFHWKIASAANGTGLSSTEGDSVGLNNLSPVNYEGRGQKTVTVQCTVTYSRVDTSTTPSTTLSPLTDTKSVDVNFYVKIPVRVAVISGTAYREPETGALSPYNGVSAPDGGRVWGSLDAYILRVKDQRGNAYAYGTIAENLVPADPKTGNSHWTLTGGSLLPGEFRDGNGQIYFYDPVQYHLDGNGNIVPGGDASYADPKKIEYKGPQYWNLSESGIYGPNPLSPHHIEDWYGVPGLPGTLTSTHTE